MKNSILLFAISGLLCWWVNTSILYGQEQMLSMHAWDQLLDKPELANYFADIFEDLGIVVEETGEAFTVHHKGDHFTLTEGVDEQKVDYVAHIKLENVKNMAAHGEDATISSEESYRIMSVLFTPLTQASLKNPMLSKPGKRRLSGIENHIHVYLLSPDNKQMNAHTLIYLNKEWMVIPGIYGHAKREFKLTPQEALTYQKHLFHAMKTDTNKEWKQFKKWYMEWREGVSAVPD